MSIQPSAPPQQSAEEFLGDGPKGSAEDFLGAPPSDATLTWNLAKSLVGAGGVPPVGEAAETFLKDTSIGRVLDAFGQGAKAGWGTEGPFYTDETVKALRDIGVYNDGRAQDASILKSFNEALIRPAATALDTVMRAGNAVLFGSAASMGQEADESGLSAYVGLPGSALTRDLVGIANDAGFRVEMPLTPHDLEAAHDYHVIGATEGQWKGVEPAREPQIAPLEDIKPPQEPAPAGEPATPVEPVAAPAEVVPETAVEPADIHAMARRIAPDVFAEYDALDYRKNAIRGVMDQYRQDQLDEIDQQAPHGPEITDLQSKLSDLQAKFDNPRIQPTKAQQARFDDLSLQLDKLTQARQSAISDARANLVDTPHMAMVRQNMMALDYRMRDLAPAVSDAYANAQERMPVKPEPGPSETKPEIGAEPAKATPEPGPSETKPEHVQAIADEVAQQLSSAGRPVEESKAAAQLVAAHYEARANRFGGMRGNAFDLYNSEGPSITVGRVPTAREIEYAQTRTANGKIRLSEGRSIITLFRSANASTFIHETGHHWLDELMRDSAHSLAPDSLISDAKAVREWLGVKDGKAISRAQHEKFARGFERYMMEGRAPSRGLARVFQQFKNWLTAIYEKVTALKSPITNDIRDVFDRLLATNPEKQPVITPFEPKTIGSRRPKDLAEYLAEMGGIKDETGDLKAMGAHEWHKAAPFRKRLVRPDGMSYDDALQILQEDGYIPTSDINTTLQQDINTMLDALRDTLNGHPHYAAKDQARVLELQEEKDAIANKEREEYERISSGEHDLPAVNYYDPNEAFANIHERDAELTPPQFREDAGNQVEDEVDAWLRGHAPDIAEVANGTEAPGRSGSGESQAGGNGESGKNGSVESVAHEGVSQPETQSAGAGQTARGRGGVRKQQEDVGAKYRPSEGYILDKAGNIRLDNLNTKSDVEAALRHIASMHDDFSAVRYGPGSHDFHNQVKAARYLLRDLGETYVSAQRAAAEAGASEATLRHYQETANRFVMVAQQVSELTAAWGRAGSAFRELDGIPSIKSAKDMAQLARRTKDMDLYQLQQEARLASSLDTVGQKLKFLNDARSTRWELAKSRIIEYYVNALISGPITHTAYTVGNVFTAMWKAGPETFSAAAISALRRNKPGDAVYFGETPAQLYGMLKGSVDGWAAAKEAWRSGVAQQLPGEPEQMLFNLAAQAQGAIPGKTGTMIRLPSRLVGAIHSFGRAIGYAQDIQRQAYRMASDERALSKGSMAAKDFEARVAELSANPSQEMMAAAAEEATRMVLMDRAKYDTAFWHLKQIVNSNLAAKIVMPFMQIGANLLHEGYMQRTPLGVFDEDIRANLMGNNGRVAQNVQLGKMATGIALSAAVVGLTAQEILTGGGPSDPKERLLKISTGWQPYSIKIGDTYIPYRKYLGPLGPLVAGVSDMYEVGHAMSDEGLAKAATAATFGFSEVVADETWMSGLTELVNAARNWDNGAGQSYFRNVAANFIPFSVGLGQVAKMIDPYSRQINSLTDAVRAKVPFASEGLYPRRDAVTGAPIASRLMISPSQAQNDPVKNELEATGTFPSLISKDIRGVRLTPEQYDRFQSLAGMLTYQRLGAQMSQPGWSMLPAEHRREVYEKIITGARDTARTVMTMEYPDITKQALAAKIARLH